MPSMLPVPALVLAYFAVGVGAFAGGLGAVVVDGGEGCDGDEKVFWS